MKPIIAHLRGAVASTLVFAAVLCVLYPLAVWAAGQVAFKDKADGSLIVDAGGAIRGSRLLGQGFVGNQYFHPRPSAAGAGGYDAASSGGSNLGPTSQKLAELLRARVEAYRRINGLPPDASVPADAVTSSASGLDPHISLENAALQTSRVAVARGLPEDRVSGVVRDHTERRGLGFLGESGVNVLELNLALDSLNPPRRPAP